MGEEARLLAGQSSQKNLPAFKNFIGLWRGWEKEELRVVPKYEVTAYLRGQWTNTGPKDSLNLSDLVQMRYSICTSRDIFPPISSSQQNLSCSHDHKSQAETREVHIRTHGAAICSCTGCTLHSSRWGMWPLTLLSEERRLAQGNSHPGFCNETSHLLTWASQLMGSLKVLKGKWWSNM